MTPKTLQPRAQRFPVQVPIQHSTLPIFLDSEVMNLSKGGVFIRSDITPPLGSEVDFEFTLPGSELAIRATGIVVWVRKTGKKPSPSYPDHPPGMGVQFKKIDPPDLDLILEVIEKLMKNQ